MANDDDRDQAVRIRAYMLWENSGRPIGRDLEHWFQAECECRTSDVPTPAASKAKTPRGRAAAKPPKRTVKKSRAASRA